MDSACIMTPRQCCFKHSIRVFDLLRQGDIYIRRNLVNGSIFISPHVKKEVYASTSLLSACVEVGVSKDTLVHLIDAANSGK